MTTITWRPYVKAKVPGERGHQFYRPRNLNARMTVLASQAWCDRTVALLLEQGAEILDVAIFGEVQR